jgi:hypothetical protein
MEKETHMHRQLARAADTALERAGLQAARPPAQPASCSAGDMCSASRLSALCAEFVFEVDSDVRTQLVRDMQERLASHERFAAIVSNAVGVALAATLGLEGLFASAYWREWHLYAVFALMGVSAVLLIADLLMYKAFDGRTTWEFGESMPLSRIKDALWCVKVAENRSALIQYEQELTGALKGRHGRSHCTRDCLGTQTRWLLAIAQTQVDLSKSVAACMSEAADEIHGASALWLTHLAFWPTAITAFVITVSIVMTEFQLIWVSLVLSWPLSIVFILHVMAVAGPCDRRAMHERDLGSEKRSQCDLKRQQCLVRPTGEASSDLEEVTTLIRDVFNPDITKEPVRFAPSD